MSTLAFVFARGGSKGLPRKNIKNLNGKPLLVHSIDLAKEIKEISGIFVSTEDEDIAFIAKDAGAEVIKRPDHLARDDTPELLAWKHGLETIKKNKIECTKFVSIPTTAPLRKADDVQACLDLFDESADVVITVSESHRNPFFNMVSMDHENYVKILNKNDDRYYRRQDVPTTYDVTTVAYVSSPEFIMSTNNLFEGRVKAVKIPKERSIDIDDEMDFRIAEMMLKNER